MAEAPASVPTLLTPEPALDRAFARAVRRLGAFASLEPHLARAPAPPADPAALGARLHGLASAGPEAGPAVLGVVLGELWGFWREGAVIGLAPVLPAGWRAVGLAGLRLGRTRFDFECRRHRGRLEVRGARRFGPVRAVRVGWRGAGPAPPALVDAAPAALLPVTFPLQGEHLVAFYG